MIKPLVEALAGRPLATPPVWVMRQAGRYLPEYRAVREQVGFSEAVSDPDVAAELTLQPIRRFGMDGAIIFADIMTPLQAMGVEITFDPGPRLRPHTLDEVMNLSTMVEEVTVGQTIGTVKRAVAGTVAVIGFCGAPLTLLAYLLEGGGSKEFMALRQALKGRPGDSMVALERLGQAMNAYLRLQVEAGADVVQVFDSWAGVLNRSDMATFAIPAARRVLEGIGVPTIYFAPHAGHALDLFPGVGADGYGLDWRLPLDTQRELLGKDHAIQGNLDPAVLLTDPRTITGAVRQMLEQNSGIPGYVANLGHGIHHSTPVENVEAFVTAVRS